MADGWRLPFRRAELPTVHALFARDGRGSVVQALDRLAGDQLKARLPGFALERDALSDGRPLCQHTLKSSVAPLRGKVNEIVAIAIGVDQSGQSDKRKVGTIDRVRDQQRIARWQFDRPEVVE